MQNVIKHDVDLDGVRGWISDTSKQTSFLDSPNSEFPLSSSSPAKYQHIGRNGSESPIECVQRAKRHKQGLDSAEQHTYLGTPSSHSGSTSSRKIPQRPQSAMKHTSANKYSAGHDVPLIVISSNTLTSHGKGHLLPGSDRFCNSEDRLTGTPHAFDEDRFPFAKHASWCNRDDSSTDPFLSSCDSSISPPKVYKLQPAISLPKSSFYERTKEEEKSPTPLRKKHFPPTL